MKERTIVGGIEEVAGGGGWFVLWLVMGRRRSGWVRVRDKRELTVVSVGHVVCG